MFCFEIISISLNLSNIKSPLTIIALFLIIPPRFLCAAKIVKILFNKSTFIDKMFWRMMKLGGWEGGLSKSKKEAVDAVEPQYLSLWVSSVFRVSFTLHLTLNILHPSTTDMKCVQKITNPNFWAKSFFCVIFTHRLAVKPFFKESDNA